MSASLFTSYVTGSLRRFKVLHMFAIGNQVPMCDVTQLILDPSLLFNSETIIDKIELHSSELISILHKLRTRILLEKDRQQGLTSSVFNCFRGNSSKQRRLHIQNSKNKNILHLINGSPISNWRDTTYNQPCNQPKLNFGFTARLVDTTYLLKSLEKNRSEFKVCVFFFFKFTLI